jgi:hypothetical protein
MVVLTSDLPELKYSMMAKSGAASNTTDMTCPNVQSLIFDSKTELLVSRDNKSNVRTTFDTPHENAAHNQATYRKSEAPYYCNQ